MFISGLAIWSDISCYYKVYPQSEIYLRKLAGTPKSNNIYYRLGHVNVILIFGNDTLTEFCGYANVMGILYGGI